MKIIETWTFAIGISLKYVYHKNISLARQLRFNLVSNNMLVTFYYAYWWRYVMFDVEEIFEV